MGILNWVSTLSILLSVFSFFQMAEYLYRRDIINHRLAGVRIDLVYTNYINQTLEVKGYIGLWFWLNIVGFFVGFVSTFVEGFILPYL
jgi:hypothetical protein